MDLRPNSYQDDSRGEPKPPTIADHELLRLIGRGSYGQVWLARNVLGDLRAVKIVNRVTFEDERPFEREFEGIRRFEPISRSHPSQLNILHVGRGQGCFYYVMELADPATPQNSADPASMPGASSIIKYSPATEVIVSEYRAHTLKFELEHRGRLSSADCIEIGLALTTALAHLHAHGLVHRDIKPSNIIFVGGVPKLADIGLVTDVDGSRSFVGTEGYLPPEGPGIPQADIYSLGKVLYEMSTGRDRRHFPDLPLDLTPEAEQPAPVNLRTDTPGSGVKREGDEDSLSVGALLELNEIVLKACAMDVRDRYQTAEEMRADLELLRAGHSVRSKRTAEHLWKQTRRGAVAVAASALLITAAWQAFWRGDNSTAPAVVQSLAVLPFINQSKSPGHTYLCDALTEETTDALGQCPGLRVAPRLAASRMKSATNDYVRAAREVLVKC